MSIIYSEKPEKHMANDAIDMLQALRGVLLTIEKILLISTGNQEVADIISAATDTDLIGESGLTKDEFLEISGIVAGIITWADTDIVLTDAREIKPRKIIMKGYEV